MKHLSRRLVIQGAVFAIAQGGVSSAFVASGPKYVCPPCGCAMDDEVFDGPGKCPVCGMTLIRKADAADATPFEPGDLPEGSGAFAVAGGRGREDKRIFVHYYRPRGFGPNSPILLVIPGAGRDANEYRDAWIDAADDAKVFVAALGYPEADYDFAAYQFGGVVKNLQIHGSADEFSVWRLRDEDIVFDINNNPDEWIFADFDRIFEFIAGAVRSSRTRYDIFGHSAGGQILHRLALFHPHNRADRIVAANSGFYTLPDLTVPMPFGLQGTSATPKTLKSAFANRLIVHLGEKDDENETRGIHLRTPTADKQGIGRFARGKFFYRAAQEGASAMSVLLNWNLSVVPGVGHDFRAMSLAAASLLYQRA